MKGAVIFFFTCLVLVEGSSWGSKQEERKYKIETDTNQYYVDYTKIGAKCKDEMSRCKNIADMCNLRIVRKKCQETCGQCRANAPQDCRLSTYGCCWNNISIAQGPNNQGCPACADRYGECKYFKKDCNRADIKLLCPVTCGIRCQQCEDDPHQAKVCGFYKEYGFCKHSPVLMKQMCAKTCAFC